LGCGTPQAIAALRPGETVLDLSCNASRDLIRDRAPGTAIEDVVVSATIEAVKPEG
jgi:hypothetical protein